MTPIERLKAKLAENKEKATGKGRRTTSSGDNASYPFWNIPDGSSATLRFVPDADPENDFFWVERQTIKLPFAGVVGGDYPTDKDVEVTVPCVQMFGMQCPVVNAIRPWWKDESKIDLARKYYRKKSYLFAGFVVNSPFEEENVPENPIRRFVINASIFQKIEKSLSSPEMEDMPTDFVGGCDFIIQKDKRGQYANYDASNWARRNRSLSDAEREAIETFGLYDLKQFLGEKPDGDRVAAIAAMFEASLAGEPFDMDSFGEYYRPYGTRDSGDRSAAPASTAAVTAAAATAPVEVTESAPAAGSNKPNPQEILARLKQRAGKSA
jgi:hypothetical protein